MPLIGQKAPTFKAMAYMPDGTFKEIDTSSYIGRKYVVLYWYPLDFTFVCASELLGFSNMLKDFQERDCEVLGISVDSHFVHRAWCSTAKADGGLEGGVNHPLVSDLSKQISTDFDVLVKEPEHEGGVGIACRGVVIINKEGIVQSEMKNNLPLGRNVDEVLRVLDAVQFNEKHGQVCPANWKKGKPGMEATKEGVTDFLTKYT
jgi:peroxiredoxin (alkyl hydroperoxide reductase subunit C)